jgi:beta-galactosidase
MWSIQRVAHGADGILQYQWRQSHAGAETYHGGMVGHAGKASKAWHDVTALGAQLSRLAPVMGTRSTSEVAIVIDWESEWAQMSAVGPAERTEHFAEAKAWHRTLWEQGVATDVIGPDDSLDGYRVVIVPELWIDRPALADRARLR